MSDWEDDDDFTVELGEAAAAPAPAPAKAVAAPGGDDDDSDDWETGGVELAGGDEAEEDIAVEVIGAAAPKPKSKAAPAAPAATKGPLRPKHLEKQRRLEMQKKLKEREEALAASKAAVAAKKAGGEVLDDPIAEKLRLAELQRANELELAEDVFGAAAVVGGGGSEETLDEKLSHLNLEATVEVKSLATSVARRMVAEDNSIMSVMFAQELMRTLCENMTPTDLKNVSDTITVLRNDKLKSVRGGGKKKPKSKKTLKMERDHDFTSHMGSEYDDFM